MKDGEHSCKRGGMKQESRDRQNGGEEEACLAEAVAGHVNSEPPPLPFLPHHKLWIALLFPSTLPFKTS